MNYKFKKIGLLLLLSLVLTVGALTACKNKETANVTVTLNEQETTLTVGEAKKLTVSIKPEDVQDKDVDWESSDEKIVKVDDGIITAIREGEAVITVKSNKKSDSCKVTVVKSEKEQMRNKKEK